MVTASFDYNYKGGWWMFAGFIQAEIKCKSPEDYEEYCGNFSKYLMRYLLYPDLLELEKDRGKYGTTTSR